MVGADRAERARRERAADVVAATTESRWATGIAETPQIAGKLGH